jgi:hypothetical protein
MGVVKISSINVTDMVGRHVANANGAQYRIVSVRYDNQTEQFLAWIAECDAMTGEDSGEEEAGIASLKDWELL